MIFLCSRCFIFGTYFQWLALNYNSLWPSADGANDCVCCNNFETNNTLPRRAFFRFFSPNRLLGGKSAYEPHFFVLQIHSSMHSHYWEHTRHKYGAFAFSGFTVYAMYVKKDQIGAAKRFCSHQPDSLKCLQVNDQMSFSLLRTEKFEAIIFALLRTKVMDGRKNESGVRCLPSVLEAKWRGRDD